MYGQDEEVGKRFAESQSRSKQGEVEAKYKSRALPSHQPFDFEKVILIQAQWH